VLGALGLGSACSADGPSASQDTSSLPSGVFGGAAGVIEPVLDAGPDVSTGPADVCVNVPQGTVALVDDFEDGDSVAVPEPEREAYWFPGHDATSGMMNQPMDFTPLPGGVNGSQFAAHLTAAGYTDWGAEFAANITHLANGIRCPYNAAKFSGFHFYAKGSGLVRVELLMPEVIDVMYGGKCDPSTGEVCYDTHGTWISLTPDWTAIELPWHLFIQRSFGTQVIFDPQKIMSIEFAYETADLPVDSWFDDVGFIDGAPLPPATPSSGEAGQSGQAGSGGAGGGGGLGGNGGLGGGGLGGEGGA
jgi:hypothetical protein